MRDTIRILFSKAVILTYIFVCYSAITDKETPLCTVESIPSFSVNDLAFPSPLVIQITSAEHLRPSKESSHDLTFISNRKIEIFVAQTSWVKLDALEIIAFQKNLHNPQQGRAPPSI